MSRPRAVIGIVLVLAVVLSGVLAAVFVPRISDEREAARELRQKADERAQRQRRRQQIAEQRARVLEVGARAGVAAVEAQVTTDAQSRVADGEERAFPSRSRCEALPGSATPGVTGYECIAVTRESRGGTVAGPRGYPYRAVLDRGNRRLTLCKVSRRPTRGSLDPRPLVPLPPACQG